MYKHNRFPKAKQVLNKRLVISFYSLCRLSSKAMLTILLICLAVRSFATAFSEPSNVLRSKRSDDYVPCPRGWYYFREKCYKVGGRKEHERVSFDNALERCRNYGADLASIESQEEQDFITAFLQLDLKAWIWIGLTDRQNEGDYRWTDGTVFNYTNWQPREPSKLGSVNDDEDCVEMGFEPILDLTGQWNDRHCDAPQQYICEMKSNHRKRSPNLMYCSSEDGGGWRFEKSCYHVVTEMLSWQNAERHCKVYYNGHLVDILDTLEDSFLDYILANIKEDLWIGIKIQNQLQQKWSSGWYVSYDGFNKEQIIFRDGTCAARKKKNEWVAIPCTDQLPFICEVSKESPPVLKLPASGSHCPLEFDGWRDLGGEYCYYFETEKALNFYEASFDCKTRGGNLVSLHSKEESDMILPFVKYKRLGRAFYIGLFRRFPRGEDFGWTDGSTVHYVNWNVNEPSSEDEKCVEAFTYEIGFLYKWNDCNCADKKGYICSVKKISPNSISRGADECKSFCISSQSYLYQVVRQSADAKELP